MSSVGRAKCDFVKRADRRVIFCMIIHFKIDNRIETQNRYGLGIEPSLCDFIFINGFKHTVFSLLSDMDHDEYLYVEADICCSLNLRRI